MSRRERMMDDLDQDIREHLERETQDNIARGMRPAEARRAALLKFGNVTRVTEATREVWSRVWLERLLQDLRYALREIELPFFLRPQRMIAARALRYGAVPIRFKMRGDVGS